MSDIRVVIIGGPQDGRIVNLPAGSTRLRIPIVRKLDSLDISGPDDPTPVHNEITILQMPIHHGHYDNWAYWNERKEIERLK